MDIKIITDLITSWSLLLIPLTLGITEIVKKFLPNEVVGKYAPLISLAAGLGSGLLTIGLTKEGALTGIVIGLTASGLFSGAKSFINTPSKEDKVISQ